MECHIIDGMVWEISDVELADLLHVSRQYINRKRRQLMQRLKRSNIKAFDRMIPKRNLIWYNRRWKIKLGR